jgi:hypothetical protein
VPLADLQLVLRPPRKPKHTGSPVEWAAAEAALGVQYPADFKQYIAAYGSGTVGQVITVLNPMSVDWAGAPKFSTLPRTLDTLLASLSPFGSPQDQWLCALASTLAVCDPYKSMQLPGRDKLTPTQLWPERPGLFPWARGDSGQALLWWTEGASDQWPTVLADPAGGLLTYCVDMTTLLARWQSGTASLDFLPPPASKRFSQQVD